MKTLLPITNSFDELFERMIGQAAESQSSGRLIPVDLFESGDALLLRATIPGVDPKEIEVQVENNVLTIRAERTPQEDVRDAKVYRQENIYGTYSRSLRLGDRLDTESIRADYLNGVLTLKIARIPEEKPKTITVNVNPTIGESKPELSNSNTLESHDAS